MGGWKSPDYSVMISRFQDGYSNPIGQVWTLTGQTAKVESYILNASDANPIMQMAFGIHLMEKLMRWPFIPVH